MKFKSSDEVSKVVHKHVTQTATVQKRKTALDFTALFYTISIELKLCPESSVEICATCSCTT